MNGMLTDVAATNRWLRRLAVVGLSLVLALNAVVAAGVLFVVLEVRAQSRTNFAGIQATEANGRYIVECTTPGPKPAPDTGHYCFDESSKRTATAVGQIVDTNGNGVPDLADLAAALGVTLPPPTTVGPEVTP